MRGGLLLNARSACSQQLVNRQRHEAASARATSVSLSAIRLATANDIAMRWSSNELHRSASQSLFALQAQPVVELFNLDSHPAQVIDDGAYPVALFDAQLARVADGQRPVRPRAGDRKDRNLVDQVGDD